MKIFHSVTKIVANTGEVIAGAASHASEAVVKTAVGTGEAIGSAATTAGQAVFDKATEVSGTISSVTEIDTDRLQEAIEQVIDWVISSNQDDVEIYVDNLQRANAKLNREEIAEIIVNEQSKKNGMLGILTGLGGLVTLPATIPLDLVKAWKIQAFTIRCIAYLYGCSSDNAALKLDIFLIMSNHSLEEIKKTLLEQQEKCAQEAFQQSVLQVGVKASEKAVFQVGAKAGSELATKIILNVGEKAIRDSVLRGMPNIAREVLWKVCGRKIAEKAIQTSVGKVIPVVGAVIGGGLDWYTMQSVGMLAIEYYETAE